MDKSHLSDSTSTTHSLNETYILNTSGDHLLHLNSPSLSSELRNNSRVESVEPKPELILRTYLNWILQCFISGHIQE